MLPSCPRHTAHCPRQLPLIRLVRLPQEVVALVSLEGLAKAARVRRLDMQRREGRRDPKLAG